MAVEVHAPALRPPVQTYHAHTRTNTSQPNTLITHVWLSEPDCAMYTHCATLTLHTLV